MRFAVDPSSSSSSSSYASSSSADDGEKGDKKVKDVAHSAQTSSLDRLAKKKTHLQRIEAARRLASPVPDRKLPPWMQQQQARRQARLGRSLGEDSDEDAQRGALDSDEDDNSDADSYDDGDDEDYDSEEEQWPVHPGRRAGLSNRIRLVSKDDEWDEWTRRTAKLAQSRQSQSQRLRSVSVKPEEASPLLNRSTSLKGRGDLDDVEGLLSSLRLQQDQEEKRDREAFEQRNRKLWDTIEAGIRAAEETREKEEQQAAARLRAARAAQEEAERRARQEREEEEKRIREEQEARDAAKKKAEEEARQEEERLQAAEREKSLGGPTLRLEAKRDYDHWYTKIQHIKTNVLPLVSANDQWRKQCFQAKRQLTRGVSQLTNSRQEIMRVTESIGNVLSSAKGASPQGEIYTWILNHLSKCLIRQAEQEVAAKQDTAFPLARLVSMLLVQGHSELGEVLMARLTKKCPWVLGYCPVKRGDMDEAAYAKLVGRAGLDEASLQFTSRMCGILAFYAAIAQTDIEQQAHEKIPPAFRPAALWTWMARSVTPPMTDHALVPALWSTMIEVAGPKLLVIYGRQCTKIWTLLLEIGIGQKKAGFVEDVSANAARTRLELLLQDWKKSGGTTVSGATGGREMAVP